MDQDLFKELLSKLPRFWGITITFVVVCASLGPSAMALWDKWKDRRSGRREIEREKGHLEVLKLRCEIELLRQKLHEGSPSAGPAPAEPFPGASAPAMPAAAAAMPEPIKDRTAPVQKGAARVVPWGWVAGLNARHPAGIRLILTTLQVIAWAVFAFFLCMTLFSIIFIFSPQKDLKTSDAEITLVICAVASMPVAYAILKLRAQRRALSGHGISPA